MDVVNSGYVTWQIVVC